LTKPTGMVDFPCRKTTSEAVHKNEL
jgi:hypothetical protein